MLSQAGLMWITANSSILGLNATGTFSAFDRTASAEAVVNAPPRRGFAVGFAVEHALRESYLQGLVHVCAATRVAQKQEGAPRRERARVAALQKEAQRELRQLQPVEIEQARAVKLHVNLPASTATLDDRKQAMAALVNRVTRELDVATFQLMARRHFPEAFDAYKATLADVTPVRQRTPRSTSRANRSA